MPGLVSTKSLFLLLQLSWAGLFAGNYFFFTLIKFLFLFLFFIFFLKFLLLIT